jgi:anti-sigma B factor antagonist
VVLAAAGELDLSTSPALHAAANTTLTDSQPLVVDLSAVSFIDSSGVSMLVQVFKVARDANLPLKLVIDSDQVRRLFRLTGLDKVFDTAPDLATAIGPEHLATGDS